MNWLRFIARYFFSPYGTSTKMNELVALCVGHSRKINGKPEGGAISVANTSEWTFNCDLALKIQSRLQARNIPCIIVNEYEGAGYGSAQRWLAAELETKHVSVAVELHFNASDGTGHGHEWLYWHSSTRGKKLAESLDETMTGLFPEIKRRGLKAEQSGDRGAEFCRLPKCPSIICEPFFGDNTHDWAVMEKRKDDLGLAIANGIHSYLIS